MGGKEVLMASIKRANEGTGTPEDIVIATLFQQVAKLKRELKTKPKTKTSVPEHIKKHWWME